MKLNNNIEVFFSLLKAGLWEKDVQLLPFGEVDYLEIMCLAEEQSVIGLVTAGLEHITDVKVPQVDFLQFIGKSMQIEQQNKAMNEFIAVLVEKMRKADIYTLMVKGQSVAQCYERPLWRTCGDVDFYLSEDNFLKAKSFFRPLVESFDPDTETAQHINMHYDSWVVEIHQNQHVSLSSRINKVLDEVHYSLFHGGKVRSISIGGTTVFLPSANNDVMIVFTHFLKHFYKGGLGVRQICDWCRLLWSFKDSINRDLLHKRLKEAGLMNEWQAFAAYAVVYLGMPVESMPFYDASEKWKKKAQRINDFILEVGNFGHNRDSSYYSKYPFVIRKVFSFSRIVGDLTRHARIFPLDSIRFLWGITSNGVKFAIRGV